MLMVEYARWMVGTLYQILVTSLWRFAHLPLEKLFLTDTNLQTELDKLEADIATMPQSNTESPILEVTEMNEDTLTVKVKYDETLSTEDEQCPPSPVEKNNIEVVHIKELPKLRSIIKRHRTVSESSDEIVPNMSYSRENSTTSYNGSESPISETDEYEDNGMKKSVSFSDSVDKTMFKCNTSVTTLRATLKNKRRKAKKREQKCVNKEARRRRRSSGSEPSSSGDELSSQYSHDDEDQEPTNSTSEDNEVDGTHDTADDNAFVNAESSTIQEASHPQKQEENVTKNTNKHNKSKNKKKNKSKKANSGNDSHTDGERTNKTNGDVSENDIKGSKPSQTPIVNEPSQEPIVTAQSTPTIPVSSSQSTGSGDTGRTLSGSNPDQANKVVNIENRDTKKEKSTD